MTGRQHLNKQISFLAVLTFVSLALWLCLLVAADTREEIRRAMWSPVIGAVLGWCYHAFFVRCPRCHKPLGRLVRSPTEFSLLRFSKRVRFCPHCTFDFEDDLKR